MIFLSLIYSAVRVRPVRVTILPARNSPTRIRWHFSPHRFPYTRDCCPERQPRGSYRARRTRALVKTRRAAECFA